MTAHPIPQAALAHHIAVLGKTGSGKSFAAQGLVEQMIERKERVCIIDPTDRYWGLRLLADGRNRSGYEPVIFGGAHADIPLAATHGAAIAEIVGTTTTPAIIATRLLTVGERTRFFTDFAETLLRKNEGSLHLIIDEAHLFAPQAGAKVGGDAPKMLHAANNLVSLGRGIGLRIMLISQRPAKLHKDSLTQVETLIAFRLIAPQDRAAIMEWVDEWADAATGKEMMASLPSLPTGTAWVWAPELDVLKKAAFGEIGTYDSGRPLAAGKSGPTLKPIDLSAARGKLEIVAREAVENDPKRLKAEVARLTREVAQARSAAVPTPDPQAVANADATGYRRGKVDGYAEAIGGLLPTARRLTELAKKLRDDIAPLAEGLSSSIEEWAKREPTPIRPRTPVAQSVEHRPLKPRVAGSSPAGRASDREPLPRGEKACLICIAQQSNGATREQLTVVTGYKRSSRDAYLQRLRERGYIDQSGDRIMATENGISALGSDYEPMPSGKALREFHLQRLPEGERRVLEVLIGAYPEHVAREMIDEATGYKRSSRDAYLQRLAARQLVIAGRGEVRASDELFE